MIVNVIQFEHYDAVYFRLINLQMLKITFEDLLLIISECLLFYCLRSVSFYLLLLILVRDSVLLQMFSILFFFMLFVLGIGSNIAMCTCLITILRDRFKTLKAWQAAIGLSTVGFLFGLAYVTPVRNHFIQLEYFYNMQIIKVCSVQVAYDLHFAYVYFIGWTTYAELGKFRGNSQ